MRMAFGLVSLLVTLGIILMIFKMVEAPVIKEGKKTQDQARQMAGRDEEGERVTNAVTLDQQDVDGKMQSVSVTDITANSALQQRYGLQKGDVILEMGPLSVRGNMSSADEAKDMLQDAYQKNYPLVVLRGWDKLTLPLPEGAASASDAATPTAATSKKPASPSDASADASSTQQKAPQPAPKPRDNRGALERQLDLIKDIPGQ